MGDLVPEQTVIDTILATNFCAEKALDQLLKTSTPPVNTTSNIKEIPTLLPSYQGMLDFLVRINKDNKVDR